MKTRARILKTLNLTPEQYDEKTLNTYIDWCATRTAGKRSLQKILTCQPLFHWWQKELEKLEREFLMGMLVLPLQDHDAYMKAYDFSTRKIYDRFSKPLIKKAHDA